MDGINVAIIVLSLLFAWVLQLIVFSPISPNPEIFLPDYKREGPFAENSLLQSVEKLGEGLLKGPEDTAVDSKGMIYTATHDGWIKRMHANGSWEDWKKIGGSPLGLTVAKSGNIIVCDARTGLLNVSDEEISVIVSEINGIKIRFADAVVEGSDGSLYFSDASTKFGYDRWILDNLEAVPHGRLLKYDPTTKTTRLLLDGLGFANGVALSPNEDYIAVCETWKFRCVKHWIKGEKLGKTEILIENLPGGPDNINLAPDGRSYWIAILKVRSRGLDIVYRSTVLRRIFATRPSMLKWLGFLNSGAMVLNVAEEDGKPQKTLEDPSGKIMSFVTSAMQVGHYLYVGSLNTDFIGRLRLD
uniref:Strictosidine synthase conserved region domain-containing protein n=1 Tax=Araucaria cunninghamii TaxID=56994 RepID=A0A0D6QWS7_ARACU